MRLLAITTALFCFTISAGAKTLCDVTDRSRIEAIAVGKWVGSSNRALESETLSRLSKKLPARIEIDGTPAGLTIVRDFLDSLRDEPFVLEAVKEPYDDEQVEEFLAGTSNDQASDRLSERACSAYVLPQLQAKLPKTEGMSASGTVTMIFYRDDLALQLSELTLQSPETVIYATESAWLTKVRSDEGERKDRR